VPLENLSADAPGGTEVQWALEGWQILGGRCCEMSDNAAADCDVMPVVLALSHSGFVYPQTVMLQKECKC
jgi:hypothetical protein